MKVYDPDSQSGWCPSPDELYRYGLWRCWDPGLRPLVACLCNPSTANDKDPDHTVTKLEGFARRWGLGGVCVVNLNAWRSRDAKVLKKVADPVGPLNEDAIRLALKEAASGTFFVAWGGVARSNVPNYELRVAKLIELVGEAGIEMQAFKVAQDGTPYHPLMLGYDTVPVRWMP